MLNTISNIKFEKINQSNQRDWGERCHEIREHRFPRPGKKSYPTLPNGQPNKTKAISPRRRATKSEKKKALSERSKIKPSNPTSNSDSFQVYANPRKRAHSEKLFEKQPHQTAIDVPLECATNLMGLCDDPKGCALVRNLF